jgi:hypothetical protein
MIWGFTKAQLIYVAAKLKIADLLQDGCQMTTRNHINDN